MSASPAVRQSGAIEPEAGSLKPFDYPREDIESSLFPSGEKAAIARLREFCQQAVTDYRNSAIYRHAMAPAVCRFTSPPAFCHRVSACIGC